MRKPAKKVVSILGEPVKRRKAKLSPEALRKIAKLEKLVAFQKDLLGKGADEINKWRGLYTGENSVVIALSHDLADADARYNVLAKERDAIAIVVARYVADEQSILPPYLSTIAPQPQISSQGTPAEVADRYLARSAERRAARGMVNGVTRGELAEGQTFEGPKP